MTDLARLSDDELFKAWRRAANAATAAMQKGLARELISPLLDEDNRHYSEIARRSELTEEARLRAGLSQLARQGRL